MFKKFCSVFLIAALFACSVTAFADDTLPADYVFDFTDSGWVSQNVVSEEYISSTSYGESPSVLAGNSETKFTHMTDDGGFTRIAGRSYSWAIVRFPVIEAGKYVRVVVRPAAGVSRIQFRWSDDNTKAVNLNFSELKSSDGWYTVIHQIQPTGHSADKANRAWGFLVSGGYLDIKTAEYGEYFEAEKEKSPITAAAICGKEAVMNFDSKTATVIVEKGLDKDSIGTLTSDDITVETLTGNESVVPIEGSAKIVEDVGIVESSIEYSVTDENGETSVWIFRKVSYCDVNFNFSDAAWVNANKSAAFDETKAYPDDKPYFMAGNDETVLSAVSENGESSMRVNAKKYSWLILRFPGIAPGGYAQVRIRPHAEAKKVQFRWYFDPTRSITENLDELTADENGWYTLTEQISLTGQSADLNSKTWGILVGGGYFDIQYAKYGSDFSQESEKSPVKSAKILGKEAFVDLENHTVSVDTENALTPQTIGTVTESDIEITALDDTVRIAAVENSSHTEQTISYVSANFCFDITNADNVTKRWTFKNISRNGSVFDLTDSHWVKAHMSNDMYPSFSTSQLPDGNALIMPTNDGDETYSKLVQVKSDGKSFLRVKLTNSSKYNWVVTRLDNLEQNKYIKYVYKCDSSSVTPRWTTGKGYGNGVTKYVNSEKGPGAWSIYMGNIGSCNTHNNYDLQNKAMALHVNKYSFDLRYVACFDTYEQMLSYDPSVQSATINGVFGSIDPFEHKIVFDQSAGSADDVELNTYLNAKYEKKGKAFTYPSGAVAQKYIVTDCDGAKTVWTVQLGEGDTSDIVSITSEGNVEFNDAPKMKFASLYKDGKLIGTKKTANDRIEFEYPEETGIYTVRAFAWDEKLKPLANAERKDVSYGNTVILGDSYSTFEGYIPSENSVWYTKGGHSNTDVTDVEQTWWKLIENSNSGNKILLNESSSGTTVCNTGYGGSDYSDRSFITRLDKLINSGYFTKNKVDTLFVFGGTNDAWAGSPAGEIKYADWTSDDKKKSIPAFCYLLDRIKKASPETNIICIFNTSLTEELTAGYTKACEHYGADYVSLNVIDKLGGHPSVKGMKQIEEQILNR